MVLKLGQISRVCRCSVEELVQEIINSAEVLKAALSGMFYIYVHVLQGFI